MTMINEQKFIIVLQRQKYFSQTQKYFFKRIQFSQQFIFRTQISIEPFLKFQAADNFPEGRKMKNSCSWKDWLKSLLLCLKIEFRFIFNFFLKFRSSNKINFFFFPIQAYIEPTIPKINFERSHLKFDLLNIYPEHTTVTNLSNISIFFCFFRLVWVWSV